MQPRGLLFDYGGTLVEETSVDIRAGNEWLLAQASFRPPGITLDDVLKRAERVGRDVAARRDVVHLETPWPMLTRLIHDALGVRFEAPMMDLEAGFWRASVRTRAMPGARAALQRCRQSGIVMAVVSNSSFGSHVIAAELAQYGLTEHLEFVLVSADYAVRKPSPLLFDVAAAKLGVPPGEIWFVGDRLDTDIAGAKAVGMTAVWFNPAGARDPERRADVTVASWDELARRAIG
jgi:putative hydrolase of the HAD superfamily